MRWRKVVNKHVNGFWARQLRQSVELYSSLKHLTASEYWPGRKHPLIQNVIGQRDIPQVGTRLKFVAATYILQSNTVAFNQASVDPTCMLCQQDPETTEHFLVSCKAHDAVRKPILETFIGQMLINIQNIFVRHYT